LDISAGKLSQKLPLIHIIMHLTVSGPSVNCTDEISHV